MRPRATSICVDRAGSDLNDDPNPLLIVADGATVAIEDSDLETQDRVPLVSTPLALLLDDDLDFETEANVLDVRKANGVIGLTMDCLLYTSPSPRDQRGSRMPSSA